LYINYEQSRVVISAKRTKDSHANTEAATARLSSPFRFSGPRQADPARKPAAVGAPFGTSILMMIFDSRPLARRRAARSRERLGSDEMRFLPVSSISSLAIVRGLVKTLMRADADDERRRKRKLSG